MALGCGIGDAPLEVALGYLNNLAHVEGMKPVYQFGFFVRTFGSYDEGVIRRGLVDGSDRASGQSAFHRDKPRGDERGDRTTD